MWFMDKCEDLGEGYECHQGVTIRFKWIKPIPCNIRNEVKYWKKRHGKNGI